MNFYYLWQAKYCCYYAQQLAKCALLLKCLLVREPNDQDRFSLPTTK